MKKATPISGCEGQVNDAASAWADRATAFHAAMHKVLDRIAPPLVASMTARGQCTQKSLIASIGDALLTYGPLDRDVYTKHADFLAYFNAKQIKFKRQACDLLAKQWLERRTIQC